VNSSTQSTPSTPSSNSSISQPAFRHEWQKSVAQTLIILALMGMGGKATKLKTANQKQQRNGEHQRAKTSAD
jgi:hypothetical protein